MTGNGLNANGFSSLLQGSLGSQGIDRSSSLAALSAVESALQSSWSPSLTAAALGLNSSTYVPPMTNGSDNSNLERAARMYRNAASLCDATCTWSGHLPSRTYKNATYSCKVFLGGVPWDITEVSLTNAFKQFGSIKVTVYYKFCILFFLDPSTIYPLVLWPTAIESIVCNVSFIGYRTWRLHLFTKQRNWHAVRIWLFRKLKNCYLSKWLIT